MRAAAARFLPKNSGRVSSLFRHGGNASSEVHGESRHNSRVIAAAFGSLTIAASRARARSCRRAQDLKVKENVKVQVGREPSAVCTPCGTGLGADGRYIGDFTPTPNPSYIPDRLAVWDRIHAKAQAELKSKPRDPISITLPDGSKLEGISWATTPMEIAEGISKRLAADSVAALVTYTSGFVDSVAGVEEEEEDDMEDEDEDDESTATKLSRLWDLTRPLEGDCSIELIKFDDPRGQQVFWHSSAHMMGCSLEKEFGGHLGIGPPVEGGFYYDVFLGSKRVSDADYPQIKKGIDDLRKDDQPFERLVVTREEALELFAGNPFKVDLIQRKVPPGTLTSAYRCGDLVDLCRGPHVPTTGRVKAFEVTKSSSAYYLGSQENDALQRVYGVSFPSAKQLKAHLKVLEEAKERDHRRIGKQQQLFFFDALTSPGSCFWTGHGARIYNRLQELMRAEYRARGFEEVMSPNIYSADLFKRSGHYDNYREDMYGFKVEGQEWFLKPMNCPGHCMMFGSKPRSYRELPMRLADFGVLHRNELSGTLSGLTRVRRFQQDDAHIFCAEQHIKDEVASALKFVFDIYSIFGFEFTLALSTRPKKALGSIELWDRAEQQLREALDGTGKPWSLKKGDGAFYGPKIDIQLKDALGRGHQCGTVQLDFQLPIRFDLRYQTEVGESTQPDSTISVPEGERDLPAGFERPVILHRAILGSVERMLGVLCEHYAGRWPFWLSPRQVMVVPVSADAFEYASYVKEFLYAKGYHAEVNLSDRTMNKKIREAQIDQFNYILVVGLEEENNMTVNIRLRGQKKPVGTKGLQELADEFEEMNNPGALRSKAVPIFRRASAA